MALYRGSTKLSGVGKGFEPINQGTTGQVLKKSGNGYGWENESGSTVNDTQISFTGGGVACGDITLNQSTAETIAIPGNVALTQVQYDALPASKNTDGNFYFVYNS